MEADADTLSIFVKTRGMLTGKEEQLFVLQTQIEERRKKKQEKAEDAKEWKCQNGDCLARTLMEDQTHQQVQTGLLL